MMKQTGFVSSSSIRFGSLSLLFFLLLTCLWSLSFLTPTSAADPTEIVGLTSFYHSLNGGNWKVQTHWLNGGDPCNSTTGVWYGLTCDSNQHIIGISLSGNNLVGPMPSATVWGAFNYLSTVGVGFNSISGSLSPLMSIGSALSSFDFQSNLLTGPLPSTELLTTPNITSIYVVNNQISGNIPIELGTLKKLSVLGLSYNALTGIIPPELSGCTSLSQIFLGGNKLTGTLPASYGSLPSLIIFAAELNVALTGPIPDSWQNLTNMFVFGIYGANLTGSFPTWINKWPNLLLFWLNGNQLTGNIFPQICSCTGLSLLDLSHNQLTGDIDPCLSSLTGLGTLNLGHNKFTGVIPSTLGSLVNVKTLDLSFNNLTTITGIGLPRSMNGMVKLQKLSLAHNRYLDINIDGTEGVINSGGIEPLSQLPYLTLLDLSYTGLTGNVASLSLNAPGHIFSNLWTSLVDLNLAGNSLTGKPSGNIVSAMPIVSKLDISNNPSLQGDIDDLSGLITVIVTNCPLLRWSGSLPTSIIVASNEGTITVPTVEGVVCPQFTGALEPRVWEVDPSYYNYALCTCDAGYYGSAPNCTIVPTSQEATRSPAAPIVWDPTSVDSSLTASLRAFAANDFGSNRRLSGMDYSYVIDAPTLTSTPVVAIYLTFTFNRTFFIGFDNLIQVYSGDKTLTGTRFAQMRGVDSMMTNLVDSPETSMNQPNGQIQTAIVLGDIATIHFASRDAMGDHFTVDYRLSSECPTGYQSTTDGTFCQLIPPTFSTNSAIQITVYVFNGAVIGFLLFLVAVVFIRSRSTVIRASSVLFNQLCLFGLILLALSGIFWCLTPSVAVCHLRGWFTPISLVISLGTILVKSDRIRRIFNRTKLQKVSIPNSTLLQSLGLLLLPQLALSLGYSIGSVADYGLSVGSGPTSGYNVHTCHTSNGFQGWYAIQILYICLLLAYALFNAYHTRSTPSQFNESVWMASAVYVFVFYGIILLPLQLLISSNPDGIAIVNGLGLGFASLSLSVLLFGHKLFALSKGGNGVTQVYGLGTGDGTGKTDMSALEENGKTIVTSHSPTTPNQTKQVNQPIVNSSQLTPSQPNNQIRAGAIQDSEPGATSLNQPMSLVSNSVVQTTPTTGPITASPLPGLVQPQHETPDEQV